MKNPDVYETVREVVYRHISDMLDHPDGCGIYPTSKCYHELSKTIADAIPRKSLSGSWNRWRDMFLNNLKREIHEKEI